MCYEIETEDIYKDMLQDRHLFDTSDFDKDHFLYSCENKKVLGKIKDECASSIVNEFVGLRNKMYSILSEGTNISEQKTAIKRKVVETKLRHCTYKSCLLDSKIEMCSMNQIRSYDHQLYSISMRKISLHMTTSAMCLIMGVIH